MRYLAPVATQYPLEAGILDLIRLTRQLNLIVSNLEIVFLLLGGRLHARRILWWQLVNQNRVNAEGNAERKSRHKQVRTYPRQDLPPRHARLRFILLAVGLRTLARQQPADRRHDPAGAQTGNR